MNSETFVLLSGALTFGVPCAIAIRELVILRRSGGGSWRPETPSPVDPPPKPLPDCLIPKRIPSLPASAAPRRLELV